MENSEYEIPEMPDYCHCSSNGECDYCLALLEEILRDELEEQEFSVYDKEDTVIFTGSLEECQEFHAEGEASMRVHLWVK